ncbi:ankyrin [Mytilinidion resinicola]|uniref:Ankyrin n=1 Tax=Mytilinidion resinicola TaxID=574789 RepID=A0A6A6YQE6_9PEZI|nr:ankyrin [Mytilinidion resinicola]KAF2811122.1 ankyrin [Mytilinidion resinicola]
MYYPSGTESIYSREPLLWAAANGHTMTMSFLLRSAEFDANSKRYDLERSLLLAAANGHDTIVKMLFDRADLDPRDSHGRTPLWAAVARHDAMISLLLDTGKADINSPDNEGLTPLSVAIMNGRESTIKLLLDRGANIELANKPVMLID